jgi:hypothetical protein
LSTRREVTYNHILRRPTTPIGNFPLEERTITCPCGVVFSGMYAPKRVWCPVCENKSDRDKREIKAGRARA